MNLKLLNCPNCGGPVSLENRNQNEFVCPYCQSHFLLKDVDLSKVNNTTLPFCIKLKGSFPDCEAFKTTLSSVNEIVNTYTNQEEIVSQILEHSKYNNEVATEVWKPEDLEKINHLLKKILLPDEKPIFYKTAAVLEMNKMKTGMFITNKRVGYILGRKVYQFAYDEIEAFTYETVGEKYVWWYPNGEEKIFIASSNESSIQIGEVLAYIFLSIWQENGHNKILLKQKW